MVEDTNREARLNLSPHSWIVDEGFGNGLIYMTDEFFRKIVDEITTSDNKGGH